MAKKFIMLPMFDPNNWVSGIAYVLAIPIYVLLLIADATIFLVRGREK